MKGESTAVKRAKAYLRGEEFTQDQLNQCLKELKNQLEFGYARRLIAKYGRDDRLGAISAKSRAFLCQQLALCTSKDPDVSAATRHDEAHKLLAERFTLDAADPAEITTDQETLGIAGGIWKRKWRAFGQIEDLHRALAYYVRGNDQGVSNDYGYTGINAAFIYDMLAFIGERPAGNRDRARTIRRAIVDELKPPAELPEHSFLNQGWWYRATLAEAHFGLGNFGAAKRLLQEAVAQPDVAYWEYETTASQLLDLAWIQDELGRGTRKDVMEVLEVLTETSANLDSVLTGKVGLALSGGGFRASFFHLGVLARLAELDVLRHVDVLSCVSGGSIIGAAYYLKVRELLSKRTPVEADYVALVQDLIQHFERWIGEDIRGKIQDSWLGILRNLWDKQGGLDSGRLAAHMDRILYAPLAKDSPQLLMSELNVVPVDHDPAWRQQGEFNPRRHNWRRTHKVPQLILNATTMNTGHAWQFTTSWMGESPYAIHDEVDSVRRLRRTWYSDIRRVTLGEAVAASAAVPGLFGPLRLPQLYQPDEHGPAIDVFLVDGGVYDNEGTVSLLATDCNVLIVSDAAGQLTASHEAPQGIKGRLGFAGRSVSVLMERIRQANYADLKNRVRSGQLRGLMFLHMKDDLSADPVEWVGSQERYPGRPWTALSRSGVRRDVQQRLSDLRTDLNAFTCEERRLLMACGYQMAVKLFDKSLEKIPGLAVQPTAAQWIFAPELDELRNTDEKDRRALLQKLDEGARVVFNPD